MTPTTFIYPAAFLSSSTTEFSGIKDVLIYPLYQEDCTGPPESCVIVQYMNGQTTGAFPADQFDQCRVYTYNTNGVATLTITDLTVPISVTHEPSSIALLGTGLLGVAGVVKRRFE